MIQIQDKNILAKYLMWMLTFFDSVNRYKIDRKLNLSFNEVLFRFILFHQFTLLITLIRLKFCFNIFFYILGDNCVIFKIKEFLSL